MTDYPRPPFAPQAQAVPGSQKKMDPYPDCGEQSYKGSGRLANKIALITGADVARHCPVCRGGHAHRAVDLAPLAGASGQRATLALRGAVNHSSVLVRIRYNYRRR